MKVLFDTNAVVAAVVEGHPFHERAYPWIEKALAGDVTYYICQHSLAEIYAVLTTMKVQPRIFPELAQRLIEENTKLARVVQLGLKDYRWCIGYLADAGQPGGIIYDALIARAAVKVRADRLLTFDPDDFRRVLPQEHHRMIFVPS